MLDIVSFVMYFYMPLLGLVVGSFLNVVIYRLPEGQSIIKSSSHCLTCGSKIRWYDNIPLISWLILRGRCRSCGAKISIQYPLVELINCLLWTIVYVWFGFHISTFIYLLMISCLICVTVVDWKTFEIPSQFNIYLLILGILYSLYDWTNILSHVIGAICVSLFLTLIFIVTQGNGIGFGDVKLMLTCGLIVGWKVIIVGFLLGCIYAIVIHSLRMKITGEGHKLAFGPYLSAGVITSLFVGDYLMNLYLKILGV